jgi:hypothetical protein
MNVLILLIVAIAFYFVGKIHSRLNRSAEAILIVDTIVKVDKKLSLYGKSIQQLSTKEIMVEMMKQLKLDLCN